MGNSFVAIDFETANDSRSSVCEVGLSFVENGRITETRSWLVQPKDNLYDDFNISIHGITPKDTDNSPEFDIVWKEILPLIQGKYLIAHNAAFDMYVLRDVLNLYELEYPDIKTFCSYRIAKKVFPGLYSYNLLATCDFLNIPLEHHRAGNDAKACAEIFLKCLQARQITNFEQFTDKYRMKPGVMSSNDRSYVGPSLVRKQQGKEADARLISGDSSKYETDNLFFEKSVVFTGTLSSMERKQAMQVIADIGGVPENGITSKTNFLVVGQQNFKIVGQNGLSGKQKEAAKRLEQGQDIEIISEQDFLQNVSYEPASSPVSKKTERVMQIDDVLIIKI